MGIAKKIAMSVAAARAIDDNDKKERGLASRVKSLLKGVRYGHKNR